MRMRDRVTKITSLVMAAFAVLLFFVFPVSAEFRNTPITALIPIVCKKADVKSGSNKYEIVIEKLDEASPLPAKNTIKFDGSGQTNYEIKIEEPGTYQYKVYEKTGSNKKIIYDDTEYTVTLFVTQDDDGKLDYQVILSKGGLIKPTSCKFVNEAVKDPDPFVPATGEAVSKFLPYAVAAFAIGGVILILAFRRRKEETDG